MSPQEQEEACPQCPDGQLPSFLSQVKWLSCDSCETWYHAWCLKISADECDCFDVFHCPQCEPTKGKSTCE